MEPSLVETVSPRKQLRDPNDDARLRRGPGELGAAAGDVLEIASGHAPVFAVAYVMGGVGVVLFEVKQVVHCSSSSITSRSSSMSLSSFRSSFVYASRTVEENLRSLATFQVMLSRWTAD